ncbi:hypothetical protein A7A08_01871 [Methyloligella halotolerans]|uniref:DUF2950 domain-containing protein n=1 Tax=Methyloligella halotolerans TaxID=1177755 RepID=A0A1E2RYD6_9HYPH|nr:DUF2950 domain-containing protein [Methyloligella halotolerans]ODA67125.1 hypothetical protein A7A08_01871 [Methyloligella halotolerans]
MVQEFRLVRVMAGCFGASLLLLASSAANAQQAFETPKDAVEALVAAAKEGDKAKLVTILGPEGEAVIGSGDPVADANTRDTFVSAYEEKHELEQKDAGTAILVLGKEDWPFPIPVVSQDGKWEFDTAAGEEEILLRRIGRNELRAIKASRAYVQAQNDYAALDLDGRQPAAYAQRIVSAQGRKDGLYWPSAEGAPESPLGTLFAEAAKEGYALGGTPIPYHGYYYRILTRQGADAPGGAFDYVVDGRMIGGFGLLAYPAEYGNSGVMTFMVNHKGVVYEKDLGDDTETAASEIDSFNPDDSWTKVEGR